MNGDLVLSYAQLDNEPLIEDERDWVSRFRYSLEVLLGQMLGVKPVIGVDPAKAAMLIPVLSPAFVKEDRCGRELAEFLRKRTLDDVFKVVKRPVDKGDQPPELRHLVNYEFYRHDPETDHVRIIDPESPEDRRLFLSKVDDLVRDISTRLTSASLDEEPVRLYVAQCTPDVQVERDRLLRSLRQREIAVLPGGAPLPILEPDLRQRIRRDLDRCRLSVHIVGSGYGPSTAGLSLAELQHEVAMERGATDPDFCRLIWIVPGPAPSDEHQARFLEQLRTNPDNQHGAEILQRSFEDFETVLSDKLAQPRGTQPCDPGPVDGDLRRIYLMHDQRDCEATDDLSGYLFDQGHEVIKPLFEGDEAAVQQDHKDNLTTCDGALIYYGQAGRLWLRQKLSDLRKAAGYGRNHVLRAKAIYLAPPMGDAKARFRTHEALVIAGTDKFSPSLLDPFIRQLESVGPR